jgi:hypothetical protein
VKKVRNESLPVRLSYAAAVFQVTVDDGTGTVSMLARHDLLSDFDDVSQSGMRGEHPTRSQVLDTYTHQMPQPFYCAVLAEPLTANFNTSQPWRNMVCHRCTPVVRALHDTWVQEIQQDRLFYTNAYKIPNYDVNELKFVTYTDIT